MFRITDQFDPTLISLTLIHVVKVMILSNLQQVLVVSLLFVKKLLTKKDLSKINHFIRE